VVGVGNELMGDEGVGVHVARSLLSRQDALPAGLEVIEAGTALLDIVHELSRYARVIVVDAVCAGGTPGTVYRFEWPAGLTDLAEPGVPLSLHQWGLGETLRAGHALGLEPHDLTIIGIEPETLEPSTDLSPPVAGAAARVVEMLVAELGAPPARGSSSSPRPTP